MGLKLLCDGCNAVLSEEPAPHGINLKTYYCEQCDASVRRYEKQRDELHTNLSASWTEGLALYRARWHEEHPDGRLADE